MDGNNNHNIIKILIEIAIICRTIKKEFLIIYIGHLIWPVNSYFPINYLLAISNTKSIKYF